MNSMERLQCLMAGAMADRRMFTLPLSLYGAGLTGCPLEQYYNDPAAYARGQAAVRETFQPDVLFGPLVVAALAEAFGSRVRYSDKVAPVVSAPAIGSAAEWERLPIPDPDRHPRLLYLREALRRVVAEQGGEVPIAAVLVPPIDLPGLVMGLDGWVETLVFDRSVAEAIMKRLIPFAVAMANRCFEDGATFVVWTVMFASPGFVTPDIMASFSRPVLAEALAQVRGPVVLHHLEYPLLPYLDSFAGLPAVAGFGLAQTDDLSEARRILGAESVLLSGPSGQWLRGAPTSEVEAACRSFLVDRRDDPRFILASSKADVLIDTPPENIHAFRAAVEAFAEARR
jgi:uroporphyrinogen decarboxylase